MGRYQDGLRGAREFVAAQGGHVAPLPISEEELNPDVQDDLSVHAFALEDTARTYPVGYKYPDDAGSSEFRFFEDGRQRTIQVGHIPAQYGDNLVIIAEGKKLRWEWMGHCESNTRRLNEAPPGEEAVSSSQIWLTTE